MTGGGAAAGCGGHKRCGGLLKADCSAACCSCECITASSAVQRWLRPASTCTPARARWCASSQTPWCVRCLPVVVGACCGVASKWLHVVQQCGCCAHGCRTPVAGTQGHAPPPFCRRNRRCTRPFLDAASPLPLLTFAVRRSPTSTRPSSWRTRRRSARWTRSWARSTAW